MTRQEIISRVDAYAKANGLAATTICQYAVRNRKLYARIKGGKTFGYAAAENLIKWIDEQEADAA